MRTTSVKGLSIRDLEYVLTIATEGHFGRAANICGISQPAMSQQVQKLEALIGFSIFERQGKGIKVTPAGRIFLEKARVILAKARELLELSSSLGKPMQGELRLGVIPTLGPYLMPLILKAIKSAYPGLRLLLFEETTDRLERLLSDHKLDMVLMATEPERQNFEETPIFFEPYVYVCPEESGMKNGKPVSWPKVAGSNLVLLSAEHCMREQTIALCDLIDEPGQRVASSLEMLRQMVALGEGAALLPALSVNSADRFSGLVTLHAINDSQFGRQIRLIWRSTDPRSQYLEQFGIFLNDQMNTPKVKKLLSV